MVKPTVSTEDSVATKFFAGLIRDNDEEAMQIFCDASLDPFGVSTPRAKAYLESGEWDTKDKLKIKLTGDSNELHMC
jgi:hypothetical protein